MGLALVMGLARPPGRRRGLRTRDWSRTWSGRRPAAIPIPRSAGPASPR